MTEKKEINETIEESYRGIFYVLKLIGYKADGYTPSFMGVNGKCWVLENDNTQKEVKDLAERINREISEYSSDFLWEDSIHAWNEGRTLDEGLIVDEKEQIRNVAHEQIDEFYESIERLDGVLKEKQDSINVLKKAFCDFLRKAGNNEIGQDCKNCGKKMKLVSKTPFQEVFQCDDCKLQVVTVYHWEPKK